jgi:hypothetical protein
MKRSYLDIGRRSVMPETYLPASSDGVGPPICEVAMENRTERVVLETDRYVITGDVRLPKEGYRSRFSDFLNRGDLDFIPLVDVEIASANGGASQHRDFTVVARSHVRVAYPYEQG